MTKVAINTVSPIRVSINNQQAKPVRTVAVASAQNKTLGGLEDVDTTGAHNNEALVYDESLNKFVVKPLPVVDGGSF